MEDMRRSILESVCSSRIFSIRLAAATTSSIVRHPNFCTSVARGRSNTPKNVSNIMTLSRFLVARVESLGEFFRLASKLHYFFGAFL